MVVQKVSDQWRNIYWRYEPLIAPLSEDLIADIAWVLLGRLKKTLKYLNLHTPICGKRKLVQVSVCLILQIKWTTYDYTKEIR